jgi:glutamate synthase domain-containing protein 1
LEDILSERGACGVGFIANLENKGSYEIVKDALNALSCMEHRGGCGADNDSGDGSGVMTAIPWDLFDNWANKQGIASFDKLHTGVGMVFLPKDVELTNKAKNGNNCSYFEGTDKQHRHKCTHSLIWLRNIFFKYFYLIQYANFCCCHHSLCSAFF